MISSTSDIKLPDNHEPFNENTATALHYFALIGDKQNVSKLLQDENIKIDALDKCGRTALFMASFDDNVEILELLLNAGAKVDIIDYYKRSILHYSTYAGYVASTKCLLKALVDEGKNWLTEDNDKITPLHFAAHHINSRCLQVLLKYADQSMIDILDYQQHTPLHWAAAYGSEENLKLLLKYGSNALAIDRQGRTSLHWAVLSKSESAVNCVQTIIISAPSSIDWQDFNGITPLHLAVATQNESIFDMLLSNKAVNVDLADNHYRTALHIACSEGSVSIVKKLIDCGANVIAADDSGATPLHYAAYYNHSRIVELLVRNPNIGKEKTKDGETPLLWAALREADESLTIMLRHGISIAQQNSNGWTALHLAALKGLTSTVATLLQFSADVNTCNSRGQTPLLLAAKNGHTKIFKLLVDQNASLEISDENEQNCLHYSVAYDHLTLTKLLLDAGISPNSEDLYGRTPIHIAANYGLLDMMRILLENGAHVNHQDKQGFSPLHWAAKGKIAAVNLLLYYEAEVNFLTSTLERYTPLDYSYEAKNFDIANVLLEAGGLTYEAITHIAASVIQNYYRKYLKESGGRRNHPRIKKVKDKEQKNVTIYRSEDKEENISKEATGESIKNAKEETENIKKENVLKKKTISIDDSKPHRIVKSKNNLLYKARSKTQRQLSLPLPDALGIKEEISLKVPGKLRDEEEFDLFANIPSMKMTQALKQPSIIANAVAKSGSNKPTKKSISLEEIHSITRESMQDNLKHNNTPESDSKAVSESSKIIPLRKTSQSEWQGWEWQRRVSSLEMHKVSPTRKNPDGTPFSYNLTKKHVVKHTN